MCTEYIATGVNQFAWLGCYPLANELAIVPVRDEADLLTVGLVRHGQASICSDSADVALRKFANRQQQSLELGLAEGEENIRLILARIDTL